MKGFNDIFSQSRTTIQKKTNVTGLQQVQVQQLCRSEASPAIVQSMESGDRSALLCRLQQRTPAVSMGKKSLLRSPAVCVPNRLRSNQDEERSGDSYAHSSVDVAGRKTMQRSTSEADPRIEAATPLSSRVPTPLSISDMRRSKVVLRRCEDMNVRTGGFQMIEEAAHRLDIRRQRHQPQNNECARKADVLS
jgi:hypothetical protein